MYAKLLTFTLLLCLSVMNSCFAENWLSMGKGTKIHPATGDMMKHVTLHQYMYDSDSLIVNTAQKYVEFTYMDIGKPSDREFKWYRWRIYFKENPQKSSVWYIKDGIYDNKVKQYIIRHDFLKTDVGRNLSGPWACYMGRESGDLYRDYIFYKEFAYHLNLPNQDGTEYVTPKALGLTWIKSTTEEGVFYKPDTVKVKAKDNKVSAEVVIWLPGMNRIEVLNGTFDYNKQTFQLKSAKFYRINTGELVDSHKQGLFGGFVGEKLHTFTFDEDDGIAIAAEFFKSELAK